MKLIVVEGTIWGVSWGSFVRDKRVTGDSPVLVTQSKRVQEPEAVAIVSCRNEALQSTS